MPPPEELPPGGTPATELDEQWAAWRPDEVAGRLAAVTAPWYVAGGQWVCRRDEQLALPYDRVIGRDRAGIPYLMPEITLLFKARAARPKDEADFAAAVPMLTGGQRDWLRQMLARVHPGHHWIGAL